ncbi:MAG: DUF975 family protein [Eubacteriales bacterium]|nr:DUF975 family protein [Eubacteriales bacterium]
MDSYNMNSIKDDAKRMLEGNWAKAVAVSIIIWILTDALTQQNATESVRSGIYFNNAQFGNLLSLILSGPLSLGAANFYMKIGKSENVNVSIIFEGFSDFKRTFLFHLVSGIFIILWTFLLVIPGIIAAIRYSMGYYLIAENPDLTFMEAINVSSGIMNGHKMDFFTFCISFIGWFLLSIITFGLGFLYLIPYYQMSKLNFYRRITSTDY